MNCDYFGVSTFQHDNFSSITDLRITIQDFSGQDILINKDRWFLIVRIILMEFED